MDKKLDKKAAKELKRAQLLEKKRLLEEKKAARKNRSAAQGLGHGALTVVEGTTKVAGKVTGKAAKVAGKGAKVAGKGTNAALSAAATKAPVAAREAAYELEERGFQATDTAADAGKAVGRKTVKVAGKLTSVTAGATAKIAGKVTGKLVKTVNRETEYAGSSAVGIATKSGAAAAKVVRSTPGVAMGVTSAVGNVSRVVASGTASGTAKLVTGVVKRAFRKAEEGPEEGPKRFTLRMLQNDPDNEWLDGMLIPDIEIDGLMGDVYHHSNTEMVHKNDVEHEAANIVADNLMASLLNQFECAVEDWDESLQVCNNEMSLQNHNEEITTHMEKIIEFKYDVYITSAQRMDEFQRQLKEIEDELLSAGGKIGREGLEAVATAKGRKTKLLLETRRDFLRFEEDFLEKLQKEVFLLQRRSPLADACLRYWKSHDRVSGFVYNALCDIDKQIDREVERMPLDLLCEYRRELTSEALSHGVGRMPPFDVPAMIGSHTFLHCPDHYESFWTYRVNEDTWRHRLDGVRAKPSTLQGWVGMLDMEGNFVDLWAVITPEDLLFFEHKNYVETRAPALVLKLSEFTGVILSAGPEPALDEDGTPVLTVIKLVTEYTVWRLKFHAGRPDIPKLWWQELLGARSYALKNADPELAFSRHFNRRLFPRNAQAEVPGGEPIWKRMERMCLMAKDGVGGTLKLGAIGALRGADMGARKLMSLGAVTSKAGGKLLLRGSIAATRATAQGTLEGGYLLAKATVSGSVLFRKAALSATVQGSRAGWALLRQTGKGAASTTGELSLQASKLVAGQLSKSMKYSLDKTFRLGLKSGKMAEGMAKAGASKAAAGAAAGAAAAGAAVTATGEAIAAKQEARLDSKLQEQRERAEEAQAEVARLQDIQAQVLVRQGEAEVPAPLTAEQEANMSKKEILAHKKKVLLAKKNKRLLEAGLGQDDGATAAAAAAGGLAAYSAQDAEHKSEKRRMLEEKKRLLAVKRAAAEARKQSGSTVAALQASTKGLNKEVKQAQLAEKKRLLAEKKAARKRKGKGADGAGVAPPPLPPPPQQQAVSDGGGVPPPPLSGKESKRVSQAACQACLLSAAPLLLSSSTGEASSLDIQST
jgi:hypothetical protein